MEVCYFIIIIFIHHLFNYSLHLISYCSPILVQVISALRGREARQISTYGHYTTLASADLAVDGGYDLEMKHKSCLCSFKEKFYWWVGDLGLVSNVIFFRLFNRNS